MRLGIEPADGGECLRSEPGCPDPTRNAQARFTAQSGTVISRRSVVQSCARFALADCDPTADMPKLLGPIVRSAHDFGCAAVYEVE
jgi:hypothetical protein